MQLGGLVEARALELSKRLGRRPAGATASTYFRVREDRVDATGNVSLRYDNRLYKIGLGRAHKGRAVKLLIADRVIDHNGELIRELTLDPSRNYQPLTARLSLSTMSRDMCPRCPDTSQNGGGGIRTLVGGKPPETVFETAAFNRSATPPGRRA